MKLTVLVDNNTFIDRYYCGEPALCFYLEDEKQRFYSIPVIQMYL